MNQLTPADVLTELSASVPEECRKHMVIIGSLAAGYHYFQNDPSKAVRTKDVDCVLEPLHVAVDTGRDIVRRLIASGWTRKTKNEPKLPGTAATAVNELPAVRLFPPRPSPGHDGAWFLELLTVPDSRHEGEQVWTRLELPDGHFGLPTFRYMGVVVHDSIGIEHLGIRYTRPEMMVLANLLSHPTISNARMSGAFAERSIKRSNKDLGRVLAIVILEGSNSYRPWTASWRRALEVSFPVRANELAIHVGSGLKELLTSPTDLEEAFHTVAYGLLSSVSPSMNELVLAGERLIHEVINPLNEAAGRRT